MDVDRSDPLALGEINERRLVAAFIGYIKEKSQKPETAPAVRESLEVARQCLTQAFELSDERIELLRPQMTLLDIFATHPDAAPADPKKVLESELNRTPAATEEAKRNAEQFKNQGNDFMKSNQVEEALKAYTEALTLDPTNPIIYCNRAAAYSKLNQHELAAKDCEIALAFDNTYAKAYGRYGLALHGMNMLAEAKAAVEKACSLDPESQLYRNNLKMLEDAIAKEASETPAPPAGGMGGGLPTGMFDMLQNPDFQASMMSMMQNPQVQQMVGQFSSMFMNQAGAGGQGGGGQAPPAGLPPNLGDLFSGGLAGLGGLGGMTPEQIQAQMAGLFGGQPPTGGAPSSDTRPKGPNDKDGKKDNQDPPPPGYFS